MNASPAPTVSTTATGGAPTLARPQGCTGRGPVLARASRCTRGTPAACQSATTSSCGRPGYNQAEIFFAHLQDVDQVHPTLEAAQVRPPIRDQPRPDIGIQADHPAPGLLAAATRRALTPPARARARSSRGGEPRREAAASGAPAAVHDRPRSTAWKEYVAWPSRRCTAASVVRSSVSTK